MNSTESQKSLRVVRGPDWKWGNQDAGEGYVGTVVKWVNSRKPGILSALLPSSLTGGVELVKVVWDCGTENQYRVGHEGKFDLRIVDNATTGIVHTFVCMECCAASQINGIRWHCEDCDGSICSSCFFNDKHYRNHDGQEKYNPPHLHFKRYDSPNSESPATIVIDPSKLDERVKLKGMFPGARVKRGRDWEKGDEDILDGVKGVGWVKEAIGTAPGLISVKWQNDQCNDYRLGLGGKVDLRLVRVASGGCYDPEHLPVLKSQIKSSITDSKGEIQFAVGDEVEIFVDGEEFKTKQSEYCNFFSYKPEMNDLIGKSGQVVSVHDTFGVAVRYPCGSHYMINPEVLRRLSLFSTGQPVRIKDDNETSWKIEQKYGPHEKKRLLGETGRVIRSRMDWVEIVLDTDRNNMIIDVNQNCIEAINGDPKVTKAMTKLRFKMACLLVEAASEGQLNTCQELLTKHSLDLNAKNRSDRSALQSASRNGHLDIVKELYFMAKQKSVEILELEDKDGRRALHLAAEGCHSKILSFLIQPDGTQTKGANLDAKDKKGLTALQVAVRVGCADCVQVLIDGGSDINSQDDDGDSALHNAIILETKSYRDPDIIERLISAEGINLKQQNQRGWSPLLLSVIAKNVVTFDRLMRIGGEELARQEEPGHQFNALHLACYKGNQEIIRRFLKQMKSNFPNEAEYFVEKRCKKGMTPLMLAVHSGSYAAIELMVEEGKSNLRAIDEDGDTAVHIAAVLLETNMDKQQEPSEKTAPNIFKIHSELKRENETVLISYPRLSIMCYLISKGCPWRKTRTPKIKNIISNELIRIILEKYSPTEDAMDVDDSNTSSCDPPTTLECIICSNPSANLHDAECDHWTNLVCLSCFETRLQRCPTCRRVRSTAPHFNLEVLNNFNPILLNEAFGAYPKESMEPVAGPSGFQNSGSSSYPNMHSQHSTSVPSNNQQFGNIGPNQFSSNNFTDPSSYSADNQSGFYQRMSQPYSAAVPSNQQIGYNNEYPQQMSSNNFPSRYPWPNLSECQSNVPIYSYNTSINYDHSGHYNTQPHQYFPQIPTDTPPYQSGNQSTISQVQYLNHTNTDSCHISNGNSQDGQEQQQYHASYAVSQTNPTGPLNNPCQLSEPAVIPTSTEYITVERIESGAKKGGPLIKYIGFSYTPVRKTPKKIIWQCTLQKITSTNRTKCSATIIEEDGRYSIGKADHTCHHGRTCK